MSQNKYIFLNFSMWIESTVHIFNVSKSSAYTQTVAMYIWGFCVDKATIRKECLIESEYKLFHSHYGLLSKTFVC